MPVAEALRLPPDAPVTDPNEAVFRAGAALAALDARVRAEAPWAGTWRRRLALTAAAASVRMARRGEDEAMLRDAFFLRQQNADPGPAGRLLLAWRGLDRSAPLSDDAVFHLAETLQLKMDDALRTAIADVQQRASAEAAPFAAARAAQIVVAQRPDAESLALWLADAVLASRLKWALPLPLLAAALLHASLRVDGRRRAQPGDTDWIVICCAAYGRAAVVACDLFAELGRSAHKLIAVAPRLRARGAGTVVEKLLNEDALSAKKIGAISDRGLRRLCDRLVALGGVRELTGRATFRLYGL
jgi:Protein of unknown function (DUF1403)